MCITSRGLKMDFIQILSHSDFCYMYVSKNSGTMYVNLLLT